ncbi:hypothetical protein QFC21_005311 [Naganishia friedmannii]|uniref:Uncharacterized protein n=1 Tax=Naganishia friedmannii TaxID=89922 RepID=A0ACC2V995_9TREE|nr:hypothetical protein QFC21_005311 [Naganishia friedmannii]
MSQTGNSHPSAPTHSARRPSSGRPYRRPSSETTVDRDPPRKGDTLVRHHKHKSDKGNTLYPGPLGFEEREHLRRRAGVRRDITPRNRKESLSLEPTNSVIPHASSGRAAHSGRGGFPGLAAIIAHLFRVILPSSYTHRVYSYVYDQHAPGFRWAHPIESVEQAISGPLKNYRDAAEAKEAEKVRWLPPGIYDEELDKEDLEMFAAIEYRALKVLTYVVVVHQLLHTIVPFAILSIYFSEIHTWDSIFRANGPKQVATVSKVWFSMFQSIAAYTSELRNVASPSLLSWPCKIVPSDEPSLTDWLTPRCCLSRPAT